MTANSTSLFFPSTQTLAQWWRQLSPLHPKQLRVGYLLLHRVEALVGVVRRPSIDALSLFVLKTLALGTARTIDEMDRSLFLGPSLIAQLLRKLKAKELVGQTNADTWALRPLGSQVIESGAYRQTGWERREFCFLEREPPLGDPFFVNLGKVPPAAAPWPSDRPCHFDVKALRDCIGRPDEWKKKCGFSTEVNELITSGSSPPGSASAIWDRVILDRPQCSAAVLALAPNESGRDRLLALAVGVDGWVLNSAEPIFQLEDFRRDTFPDLMPTVTVEDWRQAWQSRCHLQHLPVAEAAQCRLSPHGCRLRVTAPKRLIDRLRTTRSDIFRGREWLLAGDGYLRCAARIELISNDEVRMTKA
jgi:hypothetical protein